MIFRCWCGKIKRGPQQPYWASGETRWLCDTHRVSASVQEQVFTHVVAVKSLRDNQRFPLPPRKLKQLVRPLSIRKASA